MSVEKPSQAEEEYFLREEAARRQRESLEKKQLLNQEEQEELKRLHYMKCPKCGFDLHSVTLHGVLLDRCAHCGGIWFDQKDWEQIVEGAEGNWLATLAYVFKT